MLRDQCEWLKTSQRTVLTKASDGEKLGGWRRSIDKRGGKKTQLWTEGRKVRRPGNDKHLTSNQEIRKASGEQSWQNFKDIEVSVRYSRDWGTVGGAQLVFRWSSRKQSKSRGRSQTQTHTAACHWKGNGWCREAEYGLGSVTAGKPNKKKGGAADEKPMNNENQKAARGKGSTKSKRWPNQKLSQAA